MFSPKTNLVLGSLFIELLMNLIGCTGELHKEKLEYSQPDNNTPSPLVLRSQPTSSLTHTVDVLNINTTPTKHSRPTLLSNPTNTTEKVYYCPEWIFQGQSYSEEFWTNMPISRRPNDYRGFQYYDLPPGLNYYRTSIIANNDYGISWVSDSWKQMLWFEKCICRYQDNAYFQVIDVRELSPIGQRDVLLFGGDECSLNGVVDPELIVIAEDEVTAHLTNIKKAWRANRQTNRLESVSVEGIICIADWSNE